MEIQILVYIGILLIIILISLNIYLSWDKIKLLINHSNESKKFEDKVKNDLIDISKTINNDLNKEGIINTEQPNNKIEVKKVSFNNDKVFSKDITKPILKTNIKPVKKNNDNIVKKDESKPIIKDEQITEIDKEIDKLNSELKKLENEIAKEENKLLSSKSNEQNNKKEVYHVKSNIFKKIDGNNVCKALFNGDIATKSQIEEASNEGADWCNYGWANDNNAYYPLSKDTNNKKCFGKKGLNAANLSNSDNFKLGINCFGIKPDESKYTTLEQIYNMDSFNESEQKNLEKYKIKLNNGEINLEPYNSSQWSKYSFKKDSININNDTIITTTKTDKSKDPQSIKIEKNKIDSIIKS